MTLSRASIEAVLVQRCGALMIKAGLDGVTINGTNASLNDPIGRGLRAIGSPPADLAAVDDSDLAVVTDDLVDALLDVAELRALENISGNLDDVAVTVGPRSEQRNQLADQVLRKIERLTAKVQLEYGIGLGKLSPGAISLGFLDDDDEVE